MTPLEQYPAARRAVYGLLWLVGLVLVAAEGWCWATKAAQPTWLTGTLGVFPIVAAYVGYQARSNTPKPPPDLSAERKAQAIPGTTVRGVDTEPPPD